MPLTSHASIWRAIDALAARHGLSPSGLARLAGLSPTAFNPSKRKSEDGRLRWPSTETLAKILAATNSSFQDLLVLTQALEQKDSPAFDSSSSQSEVALSMLLTPEERKTSAQRIKIPKPGFPPFYRAGDWLIIAPGARIAPGSRVVLIDEAGDFYIGEVLTFDKKVTLLLPRQGETKSLARQSIRLLAPILWVSQS